MALRTDRVIEMSEFYKIAETASKGMFLVYDTAGSGSVLGSTMGDVQVAADPSGLKPVGCLLQDVVNIDETRYNINMFKEEVNINDLCEVGVRGYVITDKVTGSPTAGDKAYLTTNGVVTPTVSATGGTVATPLVGEFGGKKDEDGYAKVKFNLPTALS